MLKMIYDHSRTIMTEEQVDELKNHFDYYFYSEGEEPGFDDEAIDSDIAVTKFNFAKWK